MTSAANLKYQFYMKFTVSGTAYGDLTFAIGSSGFVASTTIVYPCVTSWAPVRKFMTSFAKVRNSDLTVELIADSVVVPSTTSDTWRGTVASMVREFQIRGAAVTIYEWQPGGSSTAIWHGYWDGNAGMEDRDGVCVISVRLTSSSPDFREKVADVVTKTAFASAPQDSVGQMVTRAYGNFNVLNSHDISNETTAGTHWVNFFNYPVAMVRGVVVDESVATLKTTVRFLQNDGTTASDGYYTGTTLDPRAGGCFYLLEPNTGKVCLIDAASVGTITNDADKLQADISMTPIIYVPLQPSEAGATHDADLTAVYKLVDMDPTNYIDTTASDYVISMNCPSVTIDGARFKALYVMVDVENMHASNSIDVQFGLWNVAESGGAAFFNSISRTITVPALSGRYLRGGYLSGATQYAVYGPQDFMNNTGADTCVEFASGRFIGRDVNQAEVPAQILLKCTSAQKADLRVRGISAVVRVELAAASVKRSRSQVINDPTKYIYTPQGQLVEKKTYTSAETYSEVTGAYKGIQYLYNAEMQDDNGSGTYTGNAGYTILRGCDIAHHLLAKIGGYTVNTSSGTLGNFVDARTETVTDEKIMAVSFGTEVVSMGTALESLQARHPMRLHNEDGTWNIIYEEMNPHSSRFYRSTSALQKISGKRHIVAGTFRVDEIPYSDISNTVSVNYGHDFGDRRALGTTRYSNPLSVRYFGQRDEVVVDEPWVLQNEISQGVPAAATYLAQHLGRVSARPRLIVTCGLTQEFQDVRRGHVLEFDSDMEAAGLPCPAFRCGMLDYAYFRSDVGPGADQSDDTTPTYTPNAVASETYFGASYQFGQLNFSLGSAAGSYTTVANGWEYYNGSAWVALTGVARSDGGDPLTVFMQSGSLSVSWTRPSPELWKKSELTLVSTVVGPCYWVRMKYTTPNLGGTAGDGLTTLPVTWAGRLFEVIEATRKPGVAGDYPSMDVVLMEVM